MNWQEIELNFCDEDEGPDWDQIPNRSRDNQRQTLYDWERDVITKAGHGRVNYNGSYDFVLEQVLAMWDEYGPLMDRCPPPLVSIKQRLKRTSNYRGFPWHHINLAHRWGTAANIVAHEVCHAIHHCWVIYKGWGSYEPHGAVFATLLTYTYHDWFGVPLNIMGGWNDSRPARARRVKFAPVACLPPNPRYTCREDEINNQLGATPCRLVIPNSDVLSKPYLIMSKKGSMRPF